MMSTTPKDKLRIGILWYTGFDVIHGRFKPDQLARGWGPFVMSSLIVYGIQKLRGIIRGL